MTQRYWTFAERHYGQLDTIYGVVDHTNNHEYLCAGPKSAEALANALNTGQDCRFNCRARREEDYLQGWLDRLRNCPTAEDGKRAAKRYVDTGSGRVGKSKPEMTASGTVIRK